MATRDKKKTIMKVLDGVMDPEMNIPVTDLGLIYHVDIDPKQNVNIRMTLTTLGCPLFDMIEQEIKNKLQRRGFNDIKVELTFDPPWSMEKMSEKAKAMLGI